jgi:hypothetical protein
MKPNNEIRYCAVCEVVRLSGYNRGTVCFACRERRIMDQSDKGYGKWATKPLVVWPPDKSI